MANGTKKPVELGADALEHRLAKRYVSNDFALCFGVRNDAGFAASRAADAIGVGLWPSRGCHVHGFEIKASRGDWLRELKDPSKAEAFIPFCDYWWIVAGNQSLVADHELPVGWGLLVPRGDGLEIATAPKRNEKVKPMPRGMLAALVKRAQTQNTNAGLIADAYERGKKAGIEVGERRVATLADVEGAKRLRAAVDKFRADTGISIEYNYDVPLLKRAMDAINAGRLSDRSDQTLARIAVELRNVAAKLDETRKELGDAKTA